MIANINHKQPTLQIRSKSIIYYEQYEHPPLRNKALVNFNNNIQTLRESVKYTGQITAGSKKRLTKAISLLVQSAKSQHIKNEVTGKSQYFKISFITLTIPESALSKDAKYCHKNLLEPMLRVLRRRYGLKNYVWKAELQKNDSVHYHLTSTIFINHTKLRNEWNQILDRNGMLDTYYEKYGSRNPNSTDVHSVKKVRDMEAYLVKYVSKEYQNEKRLNGKVWDCNKSLKSAKYFTTNLDTAYQDIIDKYKQSGEVKEFIGERFAIWKFKSISAKDVLQRSDYIKYQQHIKRIRLCQNNEKTKQVKKVQRLKPVSVFIQNKQDTLLRLRGIATLWPFSRISINLNQEPKNFNYQSSFSMQLRLPLVM